MEMITLETRGYPLSSFTCLKLEPHVGGWPSKYADWWERLMSAALVMEVVIHGHCLTVVQPPSMAERPWGKEAYRPPSEISSFLTNEVQATIEMKASIDAIDPGSSYSPGRMTDP